VCLIALPLAVGLALAGPWAWHWNRCRLEWQAAQAALRRHDLAGAASFLERYLQDKPRDAAAWFLAGQTARRLGRAEEAERDLERCQQLAGVTDATRLEWDLLRVQQGDLGEIDTRLRMTVQPDDPDAPLVLEALARGYLKRERLKDARQACDFWLRREPDNPRPYLWRGLISERLAHFDEALDDYRRAADLAPDDREAGLAVARVLVQQRQSGAAEEQYRRLLSGSPDDEEALTGLAGCRIEQGQTGDAVPLLDRALAARPSSPRGLLLRGKAALEQRELAAAETWLRAAVRAAPDDTEALHLLVRCLQAQDKEAEAAALAGQLEALRQDRQQFNDLIRAIVQQPDDAKPRHEAGVLAVKHGRDEEGVRLLESALLAKGDRRPTHAALADYYLRRGDPARAETHRRLAEAPEVP
jgi:tetratricopeptide (TPR) repeat protein